MAVLTHGGTALWRDFGTGEASSAGRDFQLGKKVDVACLSSLLLEDRHTLFS